MKRSKSSPSINSHAPRFYQRPSQGLGFAGILLLAFLFTACTSLSFTYNYADWYVLWKVNHYFDISMNQKDFLQPRVTNLHLWHRTKQIPQYVTLLKRIAREFEDGLKEDELQGMVQTYEQLHNRLLERLIEEGSPFLSSLQQSQIQYFRNTIAEENQEFIEEIGETPEEQLLWRIEETIDWMEDWVGSLTPTQHAAIVKHGKELALFKPSWADNHVYRRHHLISYLSTSPPPKLIAQEITNWFYIPPTKTLPGYESNIPKRKRNFIQLMLKIDGILSEEQRTRGLTNLQDLIQDLEALAAT